jgi:lipopolysaccharide export system protein LptA
MSWESENVRRVMLCYHETVEALAARTGIRRAAGVLAALGGVAVIAGLVYLPVWLHRNEPPPPALTQEPADVVLADVPDATLVGRHNGRKIWEIHARRIQAAADGQTTTFLGVDRGTLYQDERPAARVAAGKAVYKAARRTLAVTEGLTFEAGGLTLRAPRLNWSAASNVVDLPDPVTLTWDGGIATAATLRADTRLREIVGKDVRMAARLEGPMFEKLMKKAGAGASLALFLTAAAVGQTTAAPVGYREVKVHGDVWRYNQASRTHVYEGHITATHGDTVLRADRIAYNEKDNTAVVTGKITVDNPRNHVEGDTAAVDFNTKTIRLRGDKGVKLVALPTPGEQSEDGLRGRIKEPVSLTCATIIYNYKAKRADIPGPLTVTRLGQTLTGDAGVYLGAEDIITLTGNVRGKDEKNQTFSAPSVKVSLKKGAEWMEAPNVKATFYVKDEDTDEPARSAPGGAATPPAPADAGKP